MFLDLILPFNSIEIALNFGANEEANLRVDKGQIYGYTLAKWGWGKLPRKFSARWCFHLLFRLLRGIMHYALSLLFTGCFYLHELEFLCSFRMRIDLNTSKLFDKRSLFANVFLYR